MLLLLLALGIPLVIESYSCHLLNTSAKCAASPPSPCPVLWCTPQSLLWHSLPLVSAQAILPPRCFSLGVCKRPIWSHYPCSKSSHLSNCPRSPHSLAWHTRPTISWSLPWSSVSSPILLPEPPWAKSNYYNSLKVLCSFSCSVVISLLGNLSPFNFWKSVFIIKTQPNIIICSKFPDLTSKTWVLCPLMCSYSTLCLPHVFKAFITVTVASSLYISMQIKRAAKRSAIFY